MENDMLELDIKVIDSGFTRTMGSMLTVGNKGRISFSDEGIAKLQIEKDEYCIFGEVGNDFYIAKRPMGEGLFGFPINKPKTSKVLYVNSIKLVHIPLGKYNFSDVIIKGNFNWFKLIKTE